MTGQIVKVEWIDSRGASAQWQYREDIEKFDTCKMVSVGQLVEDHPEYVQIAPHFSVEEKNEDQQFCGVMTIPKVSIRRMDDLTAI